MKYLLYILAALALLAMFSFSGLLARYNLTHPFWNTNATIFGGLIGAAIAAILFWLGAKKPKFAGYGMMGIILIFIVSLIITVYYANIFVNAEEFESLALRVWHIGSYGAIATYVTLVAVYLRTALDKRAARK